MNLDDYIDNIDDKTPEPIVDTPEPIEEPQELELTPPIEDHDTPDVDDEPITESKAYFEALKQYGVLDIPENFEFKDEASLEEALTVTKQNLQEKTISAI